MAEAKGAVRRQQIRIQGVHFGREFDFVKHLIDNNANDDNDDENKDNGDQVLTFGLKRVDDVVDVDLWTFQVENFRRCLERCGENSLRRESPRGSSKLPSSSRRERWFPPPRSPLPVCLSSHPRRLIKGRKANVDIVDTLTFVTR